MVVGSIYRIGIVVDGVPQRRVFVPQLIDVVEQGIPISLEFDRLVFKLLDANLERPDSKGPHDRKA